MPSAGDTRPLHGAGAVFCDIQLEEPKP